MLIQPDKKSEKAFTYITFKAVTRNVLYNFYWLSFFCTWLYNRPVRYSRSYVNLCDYCFYKWLLEGFACFKTFLFHKDFWASSSAETFFLINIDNIIFTFWIGRYKAFAPQRRRLPFYLYTLQPVRLYSSPGTFVILRFHRRNGGTKDATILNDQ